MGGVPAPLRKNTYVHTMFLCMCFISRYAESKRILPEYKNTIFVGEGINLKCRSKTTPKWWFNNGALPINAIRLDNFSLLIQEATFENAGVYECEGTNEKAETFFAEAVVSVFGMLYITII